MKRYLTIFGIFCILLFLSLSGCQKNGNYEEILNEYNEKTLNSHFGFMHPDNLDELPLIGVYWQRPHPGHFLWDEIEKDPGEFDWEESDEDVKKSQQYGINIVATIWPFAEWDQESCNEKLSSSQTTSFPELGDYRGKPCDMAAYQNFIEKLVERYDGDGTNDMPDLAYPIKYWEVSNEPSMQNNLVFFTGSAEDYYDILVATYNGVKNADSTAFVVLGGMAGLMQEMQDFWNEVFDLGANDYFDIGNIHSISSDSQDVYSSDYSFYLDDHFIDKPFWITEIELNENALGLSNPTAEDWAENIVKIYIRAFAGGADKLFYVGFDNSPGEGDACLIKEDTKQEAYYAFQTMVEKIDYFDSVEKITSDQYKFTIDNEIVYVLWGSDDIPSEITGQVTVTDIDGTEETIDASQIELTDAPIFVET